jgi:hypothetical protein
MNHMDIISDTTCQQTPSVSSSQGCATSDLQALAEFDLSKTGFNFYDISIISGVAVSL